MTDRENAERSEANPDYDPDWNTPEYRARRFSWDDDDGVELVVDPPARPANFIAPEAAGE